ncbi:50S ribosomal protein L31 [Candidatus Microgenomates bacterium]|nr:50S ribosomal protein L31 [Candidatus Microgenomates bacterium]
MQTQIHPAYIETQVVCACGNTFTTESLKPTLMIDVCSRCHPFFTGEQRFIDVKGRVEDFQKKQEHAKKMQQVLATKKSKKKGSGTDEGPKSLRELLGES